MIIDIKTNKRFLRRLEIDDDFTDKDIKDIIKQEIDSFDLNNEKLEHFESKFCWCEPQLQYVDTETMSEVWAHNCVN